ncbi:MAG TPA: hypothetical protein VMQ45_01770 [Burkholderiaceae bacterium]|jgi:hypothetical protein|nr:hypothetical protein [Burkholderiaceae bacterium]
MASTPEESRAEADLDLEAMREVEASVTRLADRFSQRDPKMAAALKREAHVLRDLLAGGAPPSEGARGSLHRLRELYNAALVGGLYEESKDASLLILLNRLLGV